VGEALSGGWREKIYLATKLPLLLLKEKHQMESFLDEQLRRLKTDYVDFYLLHALNGDIWDRVHRMGILEFLDKKVKEGRIRFPAFSFHGSSEDFIRIVDSYDWTYAQMQYNYMDLDFQAGLKGLRHAAARGMNVVVMEPLKGGKLAQDLLPEMTGIFSASEKGWSPAEWALRFVLDEPGVVSTLSGMNTMEQVVENIEIAQRATASSLTEADIKVYGDLRRAMNTRNRIDCTRCRYCMPCSSGVEIPEVLASLNSAGMWNDSNPWLTGYIRIGGKASKCTGCRECEEACPQGLPVSSLMKEAVSVFKS
jgi:predicted aldo/keto reductase-like oxidoreductase